MRSKTYLTLCHKGYYNPAVHSERSIMCYFPTPSTLLRIQATRVSISVPSSCSRKSRSTSVAKRPLMIFASIFFCDVTHGAIKYTKTETESIHGRGRSGKP